MEDKLSHLPDKSRQAVTKFAKLLIEAFGGKLRCYCSGQPPNPPGRLWMVLKKARRILIP